MNMILGKIVNDPFIIALAGLLLLIVAGVFYCVLTLWAIKDEMFMPYEETDKEFPEVLE